MNIKELLLEQADKRSLKAYRSWKDQKDRIKEGGLEWFDLIPDFPDRLMMEENPIYIDNDFWPVHIHTQIDTFKDRTEIAQILTAAGWKENEERGHVYNGKITQRWEHPDVPAWKHYLWIEMYPTDDGECVITKIGEKEINTTVGVYEATCKDGAGGLEESQ